MGEVAQDEIRKARGLEIARSKTIARLTDRIWTVASQQSNGGRYAVDLENGTCTCADFEVNGQPCKHIYAVWYARRRVQSNEAEVTMSKPRNPSNSKPKVKKPTYPQAWPAYNAAQCAEKSIVQTLLQDLCVGVEQPEYRGNGRPLLPWSDIVYGITMKVYSCMSARRASTDLRLCRQMGLTEVEPHYNTILRYMRKRAYVLV